MMDVIGGFIGGFILCWIAFVWKPTGPNDTQKDLANIQRQRAEKLYGIEASYELVRRAGNSRTQKEPE